MSTELPEYLFRCREIPKEQIEEVFTSLEVSLSSSLFPQAIAAMERLGLTVGEFGLAVKELGLAMARTFPPRLS